MDHYHHHFHLSTWILSIWAFLGAPVLFGIWVQTSYSYAFPHTGLGSWVWFAMFIACLLSGFIAALLIHLHGWARLLLGVSYLPVMITIMLFINFALKCFNISC